MDRPNNGAPAAVVPPNDALPVRSLAQQLDEGLTLAQQLCEDARLRIARSAAPHARRLAVEEWALVAQAHAAYALVLVQWGARPQEEQ